jgi:acetyl esterase/lipase
MHGMLDCLVPYTQSVSLHERLVAAGVPSSLTLIPRGDHGGRVFDEDRYEQLIDAFLDEKLRGPVVTKSGRRRAVRH